MDAGTVAQSDSVSWWLSDLRDDTELECTCVLQGKSLTKESADFVFVIPKSIRDCIIGIHQSHVLVKSEMKKLSKNIEKNKWEKVSCCTLTLISQIQSQIRNCQSNLRDMPSCLAQLQQNLMRDCNQLSRYVDCDLKQQIPDKELVSYVFASLSHSLQVLIDDTLSHLIKNLIERCCPMLSCSNGDDLTGTSNDGNIIDGTIRDVTTGTERNGMFSSGKCSAAKQVVIESLINLISIGLQSNYMCSVISRAGGISAMLKICHRDDMRFAHSHALRVLATICCVSESLKQFDQDEGIGYLTDILINSEMPEKIRSEAAGVVAQVTSPSLVIFHSQIGLIENMKDLVKSLTDLCRDASSHDVFLMSCASLANMTLIDGMTCDYMMQFNTSTILIEASFKNRAHSVFARDQIMTVIANMSSIDCCSKELTNNQRLMELLVNFLNEHPRIGATSMELSACERVQQKSAIVISRLSHQRHIAIMFVNLQCLPRFVQLCKDPLQCNHSQAVQMASMNALHTIFSVCGSNHEVLRSEEASQLIKSSSPTNNSFCFSRSTNESFI